MRIPKIISVLALAASAGLCACGVKGPPIAPVRNPIPQVMLDCSPYDLHCDRTDPNYQPGLDPKNPADAKKIQALESKNSKSKK